MTQITNRATGRDAGAGFRCENGRYDVAIAYRIYPKVGVPGRNLPFGDNKLAQADVCLRSFRNSLGSLRVKVWAILDGCPEEYHNLFRRYFAPDDLVLVELAAAGNRATYSKQIDILLTQTDADYVYLAEDDYFYLPGQFPLVLDFLRRADAVDFVSPYDHPDCYDLDLHRRPKWVTVFEGHHWRTAASTCLTFLARKETVAAYESVLRTYCRRNDDCAMWLSLTKERVFNPVATLRYFGRREFYRRAPLKAWLFCWPQLIFGRRASLWVPMPGVATHLSEGRLSPGIDWLRLMYESATRSETLHAR